MTLERNVTRSAAALIVGLLLALSAAAAQRPLEEAPVRLVAKHRLTVKTPTGSGALALDSSKAWDRPQPAITRAIVTIHGLERAASNPPLSRGQRRRPLWTRSLIASAAVSGDDAQGGPAGAEVGWRSRG
jgi:hypothetical protein